MINAGKRIEKMLDQLVTIAFGTDLRCQRRGVLSPALLARCTPSGEATRDRTQAVWPSSRSCSLDSDTHCHSCPSQVSRSVSRARVARARDATYLPPYLAKGSLSDMANAWVGCGAGRQLAAGSRDFRPLFLLRNFCAGHADRLDRLGE